MDKTHINSAGNLTLPTSNDAVKDLSPRQTYVKLDTSPLLPQNDLKQQRILDERQLKIQKLMVSTPRNEFVTILRDQMATAGFNKSLMANMFHNDFRNHLEAIKWLQDDLTINTESLICNLDLVLKWVSLRLIDSNRTVLFETFNYVELVLITLLDRRYECMDSDCACFLSFLLTRLGDSEKGVRHKVRLFMRQFCLLYPYTKVFACFLDGLKSRSVCQRIECLTDLTFMIDQFGVAAFCPTPRIALKEVARQISDPDPSVHDAALKFCVKAHFLLSDGIYELLGELENDDQAKLDERIKQAEEGANQKVQKTADPADICNNNFNEQLFSKPHVLSLPLPQFDTILAQTIRKIGDHDAKIAEAGLGQFTELLKNWDSSMFVDHEEMFIENVCIQFKHRSPKPPTEISDKYMPLLVSVATFYGKQPLGQNVGGTSLKHLMASIVELSSISSRSNDKELIRRRLVDDIIFKILEASNITRITCVLLRLLMETLLSNSSPSLKMSKILVKCLNLFIEVQMIPKKATEIGYDAILMELYEIRAAVPPEWWHQSALHNNFSKAVRSVVEKFVNMLGSDIKKHMKEIPVDSTLWRDTKIMLQDALSGIASTGVLQTDKQMAKAENSEKAQNQHIKVVGGERMIDGQYYNVGATSEAHANYHKLKQSLDAITEKFLKIR